MDICFVGELINSDVIKLMMFPFTVRRDTVEEKGMDSMKEKFMFGGTIGQLCKRLQTLNTNLHKVNKVVQGAR